MEENEHIDQEKALYVARCQLADSHKQTEVADCFVTEGHIFLRSLSSREWESIKIPIPNIVTLEIRLPLAYRDDSKLTKGVYSRVVRLTFLDKSGKKQRLRLGLSPEDIGSITSLARQLKIQTGVFEEPHPHWLRNALRRILYCVLFAYGIFLPIRLMGQIGTLFGVWEGVIAVSLAVIVIMRSANETPLWKYRLIQVARDLCRLMASSRYDNYEDLD